MKKYIALAILYFIKLSLWLRYRVQYKGLENLTPENLNKPGGIIFLTSHPTIFVDPSLAAIGVYNKFPLRPLVVEYFYYMFGVSWLMRFMNGIPVPNLANASNSLKRRRSEKAFDEMAAGLRRGESFLLAPAGKTKRSNYEMIGGASGAQNILQRVPEANVVLVRTTGLYGSIFSTALTHGKVPYFFPTLWHGIKIALKNLLFFSPRREVTVEYVPAPQDFPWNSSRLELNRWLERWYNKPDGIDPLLADKECPGESLNLVSYSMWRQELPDVSCTHKPMDEVNLENVSTEVREQVTVYLSKLAERDPATISPEMSLASDLGLDSLDVSEILLFLQEQFRVEAVPPSELTTVGKLMAIAAKQVTFVSAEEELGPVATWHKAAQRLDHARLAPGKTLAEVFLNNCDRMGSRDACADMSSGVLTYPQLKMRVILLAEHLRRFKEKRIGIMLPASVAASACILACQLAGKVPVMVNWTVGSRHLKSVADLAGYKHVLSSWAFLDRLENVDLDGVEDKLIFLEDMRATFSLKDKLKAFFRSKQSTDRLLTNFGIKNLSEEEPAVILFTSGTEALPKGVPLTHRNLLSNQKGVLDKLNLGSDLILFGILPPFHSFGFTLTSLIGLMSGLRTCFYPKPTDGPRLAHCVHHYKVNIICGAPTFLKAMLKSATKDDVQQLSYCVTGAEKAPPELYHLCQELGIADSILEGYGITECSPVLALNSRSVEPKGVGQPPAGTELCVVHPETYEVLGIGQTGLVLARGPGVFRGYLNPGLASPFVTVDGKEWYKTGDLGFLDDLGRLTLSGRLKRFIKIGGEMVSLSAIEDTLLQAAGGRGWTLSENSPSLAVVVQEADGERPRVGLFSRFQTTVDEVNNVLREGGFSNLVRISIVKYLQDIPIMGSGKVNYRELQERFQSNAG